MKDRKRLVIYSLLALPFVVFGAFFMTLDPIARGSFFGDFKLKIAQQFGFEDEAMAVVPEPELDAAGADDGDGGGAAGGPGGRGGGFDPAAFFAERDADGDGKLAGDEISERMRSNLDQMDTDQDGALTLEEWQAGMQQRRANFGGGGGGGRGGGGDARAGRPERPQRPE